MNQVESWFGYLTDQKIRRGVHEIVQALETGLRAWIKNWNENPRPFSWTKTADEIFTSPAEYMTRISGVPHTRERACTESKGWVSGTETLPVPAVLIVDAQHIVRWVDVRQDYTSPVEVREILAGLETLR